MKFISPADSRIQYMGRIDFSDPEKPIFAYPNITIRAKFEGTSINLLLKNYQGQEYNINYFLVKIDDQSPISLKTEDSQTNYPLAGKLAEGKHTVELIKTTEAYNGKCCFLGFEVDEGKSLVDPDQLPELKLEYYGNSIICGYGIEGGKKQELGNSNKAFASIAAHVLKAQFHTVSYSGIGIKKGFCTFTMDKIWDRVIPDESYRTNLWDFSKYIPDIVIIELGTNDYFAGMEDGSLSADDFIAGYKEMICKIRAVYSEAKIVCCNSPILPDVLFGNIVRKIAEELNADDNNVFYFSFTAMSGGGWNGHPGEADGQKNGKELANFLLKLGMKPG